MSLKPEMELLGEEQVFITLGEDMVVAKEAGPARGTESLVRRG